ncbi:uncharacterized protein H6S33_005899 [Morchella sextelata]|uniref:uncharacterized protein n=1 Tax=Morchella sextelata TaxID=1174677 RepID=UPI001D046FD4|nr:uncharacterized protein H6S33_005899 [Morchella sextelata]KAH0614013.1 hypothetical protein H6S33_005899 [Morchella sextelata]
MIFLFFSRATITLGMAVDSPVSISEDKDLNFEALRLPHSFDASEFVHTSNVDVTTKELDLNDLENDGPDNDDSENADFSPALHRRDEAPPLLVCETSDASPSTKDVYDLSDWMVNDKLQGEWTCKQKNPVRSRCNRVQWSGYAEAALCGRLNLVVSCKILGRGVRAIANHCTHNGRAGGRLIYENIGASLIVYNIQRL